MGHLQFLAELGFMTLQRDHGDAAGCFGEPSGPAMSHVCIPGMKSPSQAWPEPVRPKWLK